MTAALQLLGGLIALVLGADLVVRAGTRLAGWFGVRSMIVGLTVVALGTSIPELAVGIDAALSASPGLAVGNIVGTNLVDILLVLGLSALLVAGRVRPGHAPLRPPGLSWLILARP